MTLFRRQPRWAVVLAYPPSPGFPAGTELLVPMTRHRHRWQAVQSVDGVLAIPGVRKACADDGAKVYVARLDRAGFAVPSPHAVARG